MRSILPCLLVVVSWGVGYFIGPLSDHIHYILTTVYPLTDSCIQQDSCRGPRLAHKKLTTLGPHPCAMSWSSNHLKLISWRWQCTHAAQMAFTFRWRTFRAWWMCNQQICSNYSMSTWTKTSGECFQYLVEPEAWVLESVLKPDWFNLVWSRYSW